MWCYVQEDRRACIGYVSNLQLKTGTWKIVLEYFNKRRDAGAIQFRTMFSDRKE